MSDTPDWLARLTQPPHAVLPSGGTVLAFDFGLQRTGVANGDLLLGIAHPLTTITAEANDARFAAIEALIREWQPVWLVVGLPLNEDGTVHEFSNRCRRFANQLHGRFNLPVTLVDERYSSLHAGSLLNETGKHGRKQKPVLDQVAAQSILQSFFTLHSKG